MNDVSPAPAAPAFLVQLFAAIERMDADGFASYFAPDAWWKFANAEPVVGRAAVAQTAQGVFNVLTSISHGLSCSYQTPDGFITNGDVTYHRKDGKVLVIPFAGLGA